MFKVIWLHKFNPDRDPDQVRDWWLNVHGPIALKATGLRRYVQNHWFAPAQGEGPMAFDGHVDAWFDSEEAFYQTMESPEWQALITDGPNGFDPSTLSPNLIGGFVNEYLMRWDAQPDRRPFQGAGRTPQS
jgi:uncharacterized protein (TIGR02118 family)